MGLEGNWTYWVSEMVSPPRTGTSTHCYRFYTLLWLYPTLLLQRQHVQPCLPSGQAAGTAHTLSSSLEGWCSDTQEKPGVINLKEKEKQKHTCIQQDVCAFQTCKRAISAKQSESVSITLKLSFPFQSHQCIRKTFPIPSSSLLSWVKAQLKGAQATLNKSVNSSPGWKAFELCSLAAIFISDILTFMMYTYPSSFHWARMPWVPLVY